MTGASKPGTLVYNSWLAMQAKGETDPDACAYNDLALIRIDPADVGKVNPSVPGFGGPTGVGSAGGTGSTVYSYGNSELRGGVTKLSPKQGIVLQNEGNGWSHVVVTLTPGIPGDSGSGFLNGSGAAIGVLSTLQLAPLAATNGVGDLAKELAYMRANSGFGGRAARARHRGLQAEPGRRDPRLLGSSLELGQQVLQVERPRVHRHLLPRPPAAATPPWAGPSRARSRCRRGRPGRAPR